MYQELTIIFTPQFNLHTVDRMCIFCFHLVASQSLVASRWSSSGPVESDEAFDARWEAYFNK